MASIQVLPAVVAERIAAGEVIDRPAAAVKELLENAIDAAASEVRIEARGGGLRSIRVSDNGGGIPADEIELAFRRHATSKLRELTDLDRLETFGFRGEALASIAAVSEVSIVSAREGEIGTRCSFRAGRPLERTAAPRARGTTVTVLELFSQMPARLKFMRGARAEAIQIGAVVRRYALAYPNLRLTLVLDGHHVFRAGGGDLREAAAAAYGETAAAALLPVAPTEAEGVEIGGLISGQSLTYGSRGRLALFVNRRYVRSRGLLAAIEDGYRGFLPRGRHPLAAIFLTVPGADLDVNVHPAKLDVRLRQETAVAAALSEAVRAAFGAHPRTPSAAARLSLDGRQGRFTGLRRIGESDAARADWGAPAAVPGSGLLPALSLVGQVGRALIIAEAEQGFYLIDQHRAHERVIFEHLQDEAGVRPQSLIEPALLEMGESDAERLASRLSSLEALGFVCEEFGPSRFIVRATPSPAGVRLAGMLPELLIEAAADQEDWRERLLASLACRSAIRKGQRLGQDEARDLVTKLGQARSPAVCPHGSPVLLHLSESFLTRQFAWG